MATSSTRFVRATTTAPDGLVVVDKPAGWTSHDVVARMRRLARTKKVGHAGTLDPMATGVLVLGIGRATRLLTYVVGADKEYTATIRLGVATTTDDAEGEAGAVADASSVTRAAIDSGVAALTGPISQVPSSVSAIKVNGKRAYAMVRAGESVELAARPVTVRRFEVHAVRPATADGVAVLDVDVTVECSSGTYIRALARDLGDSLGVGGHLTALRRTRVGGYSLDVARTLDELAVLADEDPLPVLSLADAARATFPVRELTPEETMALSFGKRIPAASMAGAGGPAESGSAAAAHRRNDVPTAGFAPDGTLVALLEDRAGQSIPVVVFAPA
jgi:tRNA pseudouridine55 synthase